MKYYWLIWLLFIVSPAVAQTKAGKTVLAKPDTVKKNRIISYGKNCNFRQHWYEVALPDKKMADSVNRHIRRIFSKDYYTPGKEYCEEGSEYTYECYVSFFNPNLLSVHVNLHTFFTGAGHGYDNFNTVNFNLVTGRRLSFSGSVKPDKKEELNEMILKRLAMHYGCILDNLPPGTLEQLDGLDFELSQAGVVILFHDSVYGIPVPQPWTFKELETYMYPSFLGFE
jgi:hypothetical protein